MSARGFLSYVHADNDAEGGRIVQLAADVRDQYQLLTGEAVELSVDEAVLSWGDDWRARLDELLQTAVFIIPVITPSFFRSAECRRELQEFTRNAEQLGVQELILPILYVTVEELSDPESPDEAVQLVQRYQWKDWRDLRFEDRLSPAYRRAVAELAEKIRGINAMLQLRVMDTIPVTDDVTVLLATEEEGIIDKLAKFEEVMPSWTATMEEIAKEIQIIGDLVESASADLSRSDEQGRGFIGRVNEGRKLAAALEAPVARMVELANTWTSQLYVVDVGYRVLFEHLPAEVADDPTRGEEALQFAAQIEDLVKSSDESFVSTKGMAETIRPLIPLSRDLKPRFRDLDQALTVLLEGGEVIRGWLPLAAALRAAVDRAS